MRNRRFSSKTFVSKNYEKRKPQVILDNFFRVLSLNQEDATATATAAASDYLSDAQAFAKSSAFISQNIAEKIECMKEFLFEINLNFNLTRFQSRSQRDRDESAAQKLNIMHSEQDRAEFEAVLMDNAHAISLCLVAYLVQPNVSALRILSLRTIIYLTHLSRFHQVFFAQLRSDIYVMRVIDLNQSSSQMALSVEYIRLILQLYPADLSRLHVNTLLALIENVKSELHSFALETVLEIACKRPQLACECRIFDDLTSFVMNVCTENEFEIELIMQCLLRLLDNERFRKMINYDDLFRSLIAPFVEIDYVPVIYASTNTTTTHNPNQLEQQLQKEQQQQQQFRTNWNQNNNPMFANAAGGGNTENHEPQYESVLNSCSVALQALFNSFVGVMCFCSTDAANLNSLLTPFRWFPNKSIEKDYLRQSCNASSSAAEYTTTTTAIDQNAVTTAHSKYHFKKLMNERPDQTKLRQIVILSKLLHLLYKVFAINEINLDDLAKKFSGADSAADESGPTTTGYQDASGCLDEEFINAECNGILNSFDSFFIETNRDNDLVGSCGDPYYTSYQSESSQPALSFSPNMKNTQKAFLLKLFIENSIFEALLDLYFGLPVTFYQSGLDLSDLSKYGSLSGQTGLSADSIDLSYQNLSFKCLNLFAELYYLANNLMYNEFFIDDFDNIYNKGAGGGGVADPPLRSSSGDQNRNQGIYNEIKKLSLLNYLKSMNDMEREQEVITFMVEFNTRRDSLKNGVTLPSDQLTSLSFFAQKFLSNAGYLSVKKYEMEVELLHLTNNSRASVANLSISPNSSAGSVGRRSLKLKNSQNLFSNLVSSLVDDGQGKERREMKKYAFVIEKNLNEMIDATSLLSQVTAASWQAGGSSRQSLDISSMNMATHVPISYSTPLSGSREAQSINWLETIRMFEIFLLTSSSIHAKFTPTQDACFLFSNKKLLLSNQKLFKSIRRLFEFFSASGLVQLSGSAASNTASSGVTERSTSESSSTLNANNKSVSDSMAVASCYLIDFVLLNFFPQELLVAAKIEKPSNSFNQYEALLIQFLQNVKIYIANQFFVSTSGSSSSLTGHYHQPSHQTTTTTTNRNNRNSLSSMQSFGGGGVGGASFPRPANLTRDSYISYLILILGHLTSSPKGDFLLTSFKIYDLIVKLIEVSKDMSIMKLVVSSLNYYVSEKARLVLIKCLSMNLRTFPSREQQELYLEFKLFAFKMILNIFRANILKFDAFFVDIILKAVFINDDDDSLPTVPSELNPQRLNRLDKCVLASPSHQCVYELAVNAIEYVLNLRPDLISMLMSQRMSSVETLRMLRTLVLEDKNLNQSNNVRLIKYKIVFMFTRFLLNENNLRKTSRRELEQLAMEWDELQLDDVYVEMIGKNIFEAYSVNMNYTHDIEDKKDYLNQDEDENEEDFDEEFDDNTIAEGGSGSTLFHLDEEDEACFTARAKKVRRVEMPKRFVKLYRRINDLAKNHSYLAAKIAHVFVPIHLNSVIVCFEQFKNGFHIGDWYENKIRRQLELVKVTGQQMAAKSQELRIKPKDTRLLKATLWSLTALSLAEIGFKYISFMNGKYDIFVNLFEYIACFIKIVEDHPTLSVRAVGFYCLNSTSKTFTGANLLGKFGWHTFQPNKSMPTKAFCSMLSPIGNEFPDLSIYSSIDTAVFLYNLNRSNANLCMKEIKRYFARPLTESERHFLLEQSKTNQLTHSDVQFIKSGRNSLSLSVELFNENVCVPIRTSLLSASTQPNLPPILTCEFYVGTSNWTTKTGYKPAVSPDSLFKEGTKLCNQANCICRNYQPASTEATTAPTVDDQEWQQVRMIIAETFYQLTSAINYEKKKLKLFKLRLAYPDQFDKCLYNYIANTFLTNFKLSHYVRKFMQEQFLELSMPLNNFFKSSS